MDNRTIAEPQPADAASIWQEIRVQLEGARQRISDEISNYPAPRPACDADFNHLLDERARIADELNRLHAAADTAPANAARMIEEFIATSTHLDDAGKQYIRSLIAGLPRCV